MKKLLMLAMAALALASQAQTNLVKISALPATQLITGNELVPIVQTGTNRQANVNQIIAGASALANNCNAYFLLVDATNKATMATNLFALSAATNLLTAAVAAQTNRIAELFSHTNDPVAAARLTGLGNAIYGDTNNFYRTTNPNGYQTSGDVAAAVAAGLAGVPTSGGSMTLTTLTATNVVTPSRTSPVIGGFTGSMVTNLDFSASSLQRVELFPGNVASTAIFRPANAADGQQVYALVHSSVSVQVNSATVASGGLFSVRNVGSTLTLAAGQYSLLNWIVMGTNIIYSASPAFN